MDRNRNQIIDIVVSKSREKGVFIRMALRLERRGYRVKILCTDGYEGYASYRLASRHVVSKAETSLVESKNSLIRHYLARFTRKTKRYSKAFDMILNSLLVLFYRKVLPSIFN